MCSECWKADAAWNPSEKERTTKLINTEDSVKAVLKENRLWYIYICAEKGR